MVVTVAVNFHSAHPMKPSFHFWVNAEIDGEKGFGSAVFCATSLFNVEFGKLHWVVCEKTCSPPKPGEFLGGEAKN